MGPMGCVPTGNAWTDARYDNEGAVDFWWSHALISDDVRDSLLHSCNFSGVGPLRQDTRAAGDLTRNGKLEVISMYCNRLMCNYPSPL